MDPRLMDRQSDGCLTVSLYCLIFCMVDVWRQVTGYGVKYLNDDVYPIRQTAIVALTESFKFILFTGLLLQKHNLQNIKLSIYYAIPSLIYAVNNNVFYYALHYTTPPVWNIIIQMRIIFTALLYRIVFQRYMSISKCVGIALLICAIILTNMTSNHETNDDGQSTSNLLVAFLLAAFGSVTSAIGALVMEYLFKNDDQSFTAMQCQLYMYSMCASWILYSLESSSVSTSLTGNPWPVYTTLVSCILLSTASGIIVALIVKKLDNIVKLYSQAVANTLTSVACALFFPKHFQLSMHFLLCLVLMIVSVFIYESDSLNTSLRVITYKKRSPKPNMSIV